MPGCCVCQRTELSTYVCHICHEENLTSQRQAISSLRNQQKEELARIHSLLDQRRQAQSQFLTVARYNQQTQSTKLSIQKLQSHLQYLQSRLHHINLSNKERHIQLKEAVRSLLNNSNNNSEEEHRLSRHNHELSIVLTATQGILFQQQRSRVIRTASAILPLDLVTPTATTTSEKEAEGGGEDTPDKSTTAIKTHLPSPSPNINKKQSKNHQQAPLAVLGGQLLPRSLTDMTSSTALGYAALLIDLFSRFLNLPLLLRLHFQGSTSHIWTPDTWWDTRSSPPRDALPLFKLRPTADKQATVIDRHRQMMLEGLQLVQRAAGELVYTAMGAEATCRLPPDWPPFAWLAGLSKILETAGGRHGHHDNVLLLLRPTTTTTTATAGDTCSTMNLGMSMVFERREKHNSGASLKNHGDDDPGDISSALHMMQREGYAPTTINGGDDDDGDGEWELMPTRVMAPPPSQPDEVVHWENSHWSTSSSSSSSVIVLSAGSTGSGMQRLGSSDMGGGRISGGGDMGGGGGEGMYGRGRVSVVVERLKRAWSGRLS